MRLRRGEGLWNHRLQFSSFLSLTSSAGGGDYGRSGGRFHAASQYGTMRLARFLGRDLIWLHCWWRWEDRRGFCSSFCSEQLQLKLLRSDSRWRPVIDLLLRLCWGSWANWLSLLKHTVRGDTSSRRRGRLLPILRLRWNRRRRKLIYRLLRNCVIGVLAVNGLPNFGVVLHHYHHIIMLNAGMTKLG
jgi:hypothetical protein